VGSDMDMESSAYVDHLVALVQEGKVKESIIDDAARRVLKVKFELGLFDDPINTVMKIAKKKQGKLEFQEGVLEMKLKVLCYEKSHCLKNRDKRSQLLVRWQTIKQVH
jgi:beta-glucosidase